MAKRQVKKARYSKKTVKYTEALRERLLLLSEKNPTFSKRDRQVLSFESSLKFTRS